MRNALVFTVAVLVIAGCGLKSPDIVEEWQAEADAHGAMGKAGTFSIENEATADATTNFSVAGVVVVDPITAPFSVNGSVLRLTAAEVEGHGVGELNFSSGAARFLGGELADFEAARFESGSDRLDIDGLTTFEGAAVEGLVLDVGSVSFRAEGTQEFVELTSTADAPLVITRGLLEGGGLSFFVPGGFSARVADLALGGSAVGSVDVDGESIADANAIFGRDLQLTCTTGSCEGEGRVTQVVVGGDVVIDADLEIATFDSGFDERAFSDEIEIEMTAGLERHVVFAFRERGYVGDAVVTSIEAKGDAKGFIQLAATPPPGAATTIIGQMTADGDINAGEAIILVVAGPAIIIVDVITSIGDFFGGDSDAPLQPVPIPSWVQAGQVGTFTIVVSIPGDANVGDDFKATVVVAGANFEEQKLEFTITIVDD